MASPKKSGMAFWATVVVVCLPILYVASFGPACWITSRIPDGDRAALVLYVPILPDLVSVGPTGASYDAVRWYGELFESESQPVAREVLRRIMPRE